MTSSSPGFNQLIGLSRWLWPFSYCSTYVLPRIALLAEEFDLLYGVGLIFSQGYMSNCAPLLEAPNKPLKVDQEGSIPLGYQMEHPVFKTVKTLGGSLQQSQATLLS